MKTTQFSQARVDLHQEMAHAYHKFLRFVFVENAEDARLRKSMNEARIKFLTSYFIEHAAASPIFSGRNNLMQWKSMGRRYLIGDYYSHDALIALRAFPNHNVKLAFEHVVPKDLIRVQCERRIVEEGDRFTADEIKEELDAKWHVAVVLATEDRALDPRKRMPIGWQSGNDIFARYKNADGGAHFRLYRALEDGDACRRILTSTENQDQR